MVPSSVRVPVPAGFVFPHGVLALSVDAALDYERRGEEDSQQRDKETGVRIWWVSVLDLDPVAAKFGREKTRVKIVAPHQPVMPASRVPGYPPAVEFTDVVLVPWVDDARCHSAEFCRARLAWSIRASDMVEATIAPVPVPVGADVAGSGTFA